MARSRIGWASSASGSARSFPRKSSQSNEATLLLSLLAFNLANMLRCELEDGAGACWDLGRFQKSVLKAGGRIAKKAGRVIVDLAAAVVPLWERLVARLQTMAIAETISRTASSCLPAIPTTPETCLPHEGHP